jgi:hydrogenase expression/formation protein HypC
MCLAVPGRVLKIEGLIATVDVAGVRRQACLDLVEGVQEGDYVLLHVGFALQKVDEQQAQETLDLLRKCLREELREGAAGEGGALA